MEEVLWGDANTREWTRRGLRLDGAKESVRNTYVNSAHQAQK